MIRRSFLRIFWGFVLICFDFRTKGLISIFDDLSVDLIPDWLGYLLILSGLGALAGFERSFRRASPIALAGMLLYLLDPIGPAVVSLTVEVLLGAPPADSAGLARSLTQLISTGLDVGLVWLICTGILRLAVFDGQAELSRVAAFRRNGYAAVHLLSAALLFWASVPTSQLVLLGLTFTMPDRAAGLFGSLALLGAVLILLFWLLFLGLLRVAARALARLEATPLVLTTPEGPGHSATRRRLLAAGALVLLLLPALTLRAIVLDRPFEAREVVTLPAINMIPDGNNGRFSPDGRQVLTVERGTVRLWDVESWQHVATIDPGSDSIFDATFSPDMRSLAIAGFSSSLIWDLALDAPAVSFDVDPQTERSAGELGHRIYFSPDGTRVAIEAYVVTIHDVSTGRLLNTIYTRGPSARGGRGDAIAFAWSPDGARFVTGGQNGDARIWDADSGVQLMTLQAQGMMVSDVAYSPDGRLIATANDHNIVHLWDAQTGDQLRTIVISTELDRLLGRRPHSHPRNWTTALAFSPDGTMLAAGSSDASAGVWEVDGGAHLFALNGHSRAVRAVGFSPAGTQVLTGSDDGTVRIWELAE